MRSDLKERGFTLLEVMIALAIISISLIVLLHSQNANIVRSYDSSCLIKASLLSQKIISDTDTQGSFEEGQWEGVDNIDGIDYSWKKNVETYMIDGLKKITIKVWWEGRDKKLPFTLETFRAS